MKKKLDIKKLVLLNLPYVFAFYFVDKLAAVFRLAPGTEFIDKLTGGFANFGAAFANPLPSFHPVDLLIGVAGGALLKLAVYIKGKNRKKFRQGEEYGSARWGRPEDIRPYMDDDFSNNVILTQTEGLTMNSRPKQPKYARNKNILVIGGSGSGKTRFFVKPNLMQMHSSYVVTDPKGTVLVECGKMLEKNGYVIKSLNTINFRKSMHYNPFAYIRSEKDILKLVNTIIVNTKGDGDKSGEDFWVKAEKLYYTALIGYIWYEAPEDEKNFTTLLELINASEALSLIHIYPGIHQLVPQFFKGGRVLLAFRLCLKQRDWTDIFARLGVLRICDFFQLVPQVDCINQHLGLAVPVIDDHGQFDHVFVFQLHRVHIGDDLSLIHIFPAASIAAASWSMPIKRPFSFNRLHT